MDLLRCGRQRPSSVELARSAQSFAELANLGAFRSGTDTVGGRETRGLADIKP
jgi:hypothetical protein